MLLLLQDDDARSWAADEINARLRSQEASIAKWLEALAALGLACGSEGRFRFAPETEELAQNVRELAGAYRERRIKVIEYIFSQSNENLLNFVRAFELRQRS